MKIKSFLLITIIIISFMAISCSRSQSPFSPDALSNQAVLNGTVVLSTNSTASFGAIQVGVKGTALYTNPDGNGNFQIDNLPLGNVVVEFSVQSDVSDIQIDNVTSGEEIRITVNIQSNNQAVLANMERDKKFTGALQVQIQPKKWNLNWVDSEINDEDVVIAKISGDGHELIKPGSVKLIGPDDEIGSYDEDVGGTYFIAKFHQSDAIGIINDPMPGMEYGIKVEYEKDNQTLYLPPEEDEFIMIEILGKMPRDSEELSIQVNPTKWNTNWDKSSGTIMVKFWGGEYDLINPADVMMIGPDDFGVIFPVPGASNLTDDQLIVKFLMKEAISIIPEPTPGDKHKIRITDDPNGSGIVDFEYGIEIVGKKK
ncbi:MAG: hypothetical protein ACFFCW_32305 [Candidatus Hodarchaeota archaeon]